MFVHILPLSKLRPVLVQQLRAAGLPDEDEPQTESDGEAHEPDQLGEVTGGRPEQGLGGLPEGGWSMLTA